MTKLPEIRERSVVRSSLMPSAKYSWSGSLLRFVNGSTTIDSRGATSGCATEATAAEGVDVAFGAGQTHHTMTAMTRAAAMTAAATRGKMLRRRRGTAIGASAIGSSAPVSGR